MNAAQLPIETQISNHRFTGKMEIQSRVTEGPCDGYFKVVFSGHDRLQGDVKDMQWTLSANDVAYWTGIDLRERK